MNKWMKGILGAAAIVFLGMIVLYVSFVISMRPDKEKEEEVRSQAAHYLKANFPDHFQVYDTLYDNMGNFEFDYAAKVRDEANGIEFLVYYDSEAEQMTDTYVAKSWTQELESNILPYVKKTFGERARATVFFDDQIGKTLKLSPDHPGSYKDYQASPMVRLTLPRKKKDGDERLVEEFISFLKTEAAVKQGTVAVEYIAENGEILGEEWSKEW
ncbi:hypothetical protein [Pseudobacillus badius]|uniref:hypothetical protein n=1 Tax=Bacillus badius TaxID=1455 RepID=UPI000A65B569|nr:hypothetical protein [Bacillus badius]TDW00978.1 hypothetical protein B0G66_11431 [Bacillus badius]